MSTRPNLFRRGLDTERINAILSRMPAKRKKKNQKRIHSSAKVAAPPSSGGRLIFPFAPGSADGFNVSSLSQFNGDAASSVRELVQNSMDAALISAKEKTAKVRFLAEKHQLSDIPGIKEYRLALECAMKITGYQQNDDRSKSLYEHSRNGDTTVLFVMDNGIGLGAERISAILGDGRPHGEETRAGAYGNGHLTAFALSHLRYVFYGGVLQGGEMIYTGHAILASHIGDNKKMCSKDGFFVREIHDNKFDFDRFDFGEKSEIPAILRPKMDEIKEKYGHGALVAIFGFNNFCVRESIADAILRESALNFFVPISRGELEIEVSESGAAPAKIDKNNLRGLLEKYKDQKRGKRGFPSGSRVWNAYETMLEGESHEITTSGGSVKLQLLQGGMGKRVAICRNGMWITDSAPMLSAAEFADRVSFNALLLADARSGKQVDALIKLAETPLHNAIDINSVKSKEKRQALRRILGEIRAQLKELIEETSEESFSPDDIIPIEVSDSVKGEKSRSHGEIREIGAGTRGGGIGGASKKKKRGDRKIRPGQAINAKISSRQITPGQLEAIFQPQENADDVELRVSLDGGGDITCAGIDNPLLCLHSVTVDGEMLNEEQKIKDETGKVLAVRLGAWKTGIQYKVGINYEIPVGGKYALMFDLIRRQKKSSAALGGNSDV